jgi:hypothetical protein
MNNEFAARFPKHSIVMPCRVTAQSSLVGRSGVIAAIVATVSKGAYY